MIDWLVDGQGREGEYTTLVHREFALLVVHVSVLSWAVKVYEVEMFQVIKDCHNG